MVEAQVVLLDFPAAQDSVAVRPETRPERAGNQFLVTDVRRPNSDV
jgi:hypothetical protein